MPRVELLEDRTVPSIDFLGIPSWIDEGPGPVSGLMVTLPAQNNPHTGAINVALQDPIDANTIYAATVNGGIWLTHNSDVVTAPTSGPNGGSPGTLAVPGLTVSYSDIDQIAPSHLTDEASAQWRASRTSTSPECRFERIPDMLVLARKFQETIVLPDLGISVVGVP